MTYRLEFSKKALKELKSLDPFVARLIISWLNKNIDGCADPRIHGKGLTGSLTGKWRYRIGDYRVVCEIVDQRVIVLVLAVGHRRYIYDK